MARLGLLAFAMIWWIATPLPLSFTTLAMLGIGIAPARSPSMARSRTPAAGCCGSWSARSASPPRSKRPASTGASRSPFSTCRGPAADPHRFLLMFLLLGDGDERLHGQHRRRGDLAVAGVKIYRCSRSRTTDPLVEANTLGIAWAANIGGIATPVGNGTNAPAIGSDRFGDRRHRDVPAMDDHRLRPHADLPRHCPARLPLPVPKGSEAFARPRPPHSSRRMPSARADAARRELAIGWFITAIVLWFVPDVSRYVASAETASCSAPALERAGAARADRDVPAVRDAESGAAPC